MSTANIRGDYQVATPLVWAPVGAQQIHINVPSGGDVRLGELGATDHNYVTVGGSTVAETFSGTTLEFSLSDGRHDLTYYRCDDSGYANCTSKTLTVNAGDLTAAVRIDRVFEKLYSVCIGDLVEVTDGSLSVCAEVSFPDMLSDINDSLLDAKRNTVVYMSASASAAWHAAVQFGTSFFNTSAAEEARCESYFSECATVVYAALEAVMWAQHCNGTIVATPSTFDDKVANAVMHGVWSAILARELGQAKAEIWTDLHEGSSTACNSPTPGSNTEMDCANNAAGRSVAASDPTGTALDYYREVRDAVENGNLGTIIKDTPPSTCPGPSI